MIRFDVRPHELRGVTMVEVRDNHGRLRAAIYPGDSDNEIRVVSNHLSSAFVLSEDMAVVRLRPEAKR